MPTVTVTTDLALAAWYWTHGLDFLRCIATDHMRAAFEFDDPRGLGPNLRTDFRREQSLHDFLGARRRLLFAARVAEVSESGEASLRDLNRSARRLGPALTAAALEKRAVT